jgi:hypothetical protein
MKRFLPILLLLIFAAGCHSQQPVTTYAINYSALAPTVGCSTAQPCVLAFSDAPQVSGTCPATIPSISCSTAAGGTSCVHSNVANGVTYCATAQAVSSTGVTGPATPVFTVVVPPLPGQPTNPSATIAPSAIAEVQRDTGEQFALRGDGSLKIMRPVIISAPLGQLDFLE